MGSGPMGNLSGVSVEVREFRSSNKPTVRGVVVTVTESQYREELSFVDEDEIGELLRGMDALLAVTSNPTAFLDFEVRYATRGELTVIVYKNTRADRIEYGVQAGRVVRASRVGLERRDFEQLRAFIESAEEFLSKARSR
jgi:hypothetical protein